MKRFDILTLFPGAIEPYLSASILGKARTQGLISTHTWDIRSFAKDAHRTTDDSPYGGGAGMVMKVEPIYHALEAVKAQQPREKQHIIVLSARGSMLDVAKAKSLANMDKSITFICGRYEGIDQRVADHLADEEISIGSYVLTGGELPALVTLEAIARFIPGVLGNENSLMEESYTENFLEAPHYTKPETYKDWSVPEVLLSGDHAKIEAWRKENRTSIE